MNRLQLNMPAGSHAAWSLMAAEMHRPADVAESIRALAAQGLKAHDIAERLCVGVAAVEKALQDVA